MKHLIFFIILSLTTVSAVANEALQEAGSKTQSEPEEAFADEPSVEALMMKKIDVVNKAEKINLIESVINIPADGPAKVPSDADRTQYRPLKDGSPKQMQATPPFRLTN
jgi:hypothetical protein